MKLPHLLPIVYCAAWASPSHLPTRLLQQWINTRECSKNDTTFIACSEALSTYASTLESRTLLLPTKIDPAQFGWKVMSSKAFDLFKIVEFKDTLSDSLRSQMSEQELWKRYQKQREDIHNEILRTKAQLTQKVDFEELTQIAEIKIKRTKSNEETDRQITAINTFLSLTRDPHTYLRAESDFLSSNNKSVESYGGIGIQTEVRRGKLVVNQVFDNSPALRAGLWHDDIILSIDRRKVKPSNIDKLLEQVRGPIGKPISLEVQRKDSIFDLKIKRGEVSLANVEFKILGGKQKWGYIKLASFEDRNSCTEINNAVFSLESKGAQGLILDLRENGGGLVDQAVCIAGLFVGRKLIAQSKATGFGFNEDYYAETDAITKLPMVTLINANSASASELLSGALQHYDRSWIVGQRSFGKGTMQSALPWAKGLLLFETRARYYLPSGNSTQISGVTPDIEVNPRPELPDGELLFLREQDLYANALAPKAPPVEIQRHSEAARIKTCANHFKQATDTYLKALPKQAKRPDLMVFAAQDVLSCAKQIH